MLLDLKSTTVVSTLADYTKPALIIPQLRERDTAGIISELSQALQRGGYVPDLLPFYHAALNQELLGNSTLECRFAIPHVRLNAVKRLQFAFGRLSRPVSWGPGKSWPVDMIFLLAVPATEAATSLHLLAGIARLGQKPETLRELRAAETAEALWEIFSRFRMRQD